MLNNYFPYLLKMLIIYLFYDLLKIVFQYGTRFFYVYCIHLFHESSKSNNLNLFLRDFVH